MHVLQLIFRALSPQSMESWEGASETEYLVKRSTSSIGKGGNCSYIWYKLHSKLYAELKI